LESAVDLSHGGNLASDMADAFDILTGICAKPLNALLVKFVRSNAGTWFIKKALGVLGDIKTLVGSVLAGLESIPRQFAPVTITVDQVVPCPNNADLASLIRKLDTSGPSDPQVGAHGGGPNVYKDVSKITVTEKICSGDWVMALIAGQLKPPGIGAPEDIVILHWVSNHWVLYVNNGTDYRGIYPCNPPVAAAIRKHLRCNV
jgi:hypothetical protein